MKMLEKILFAGFGGQGILSIGKILADACVENQLEASWLPSYGPEMRGGTCNCLVVTSDEKILSPYFVEPTNAIIMNQASLERFLGNMAHAKMIVVNSSLVKLTAEQREKLKGVTIVEVAATDIAIHLGAVKCANMVMLGAYARHSSALDLERLKASIEKKFASKPMIVEMNKDALDEGYKIA